ncbi:MAG TPA: hypothetical protein VHC86_10100 [Opitutaceae bacterium]|nr:hypothetical protein [Opitutaceae bacterium]
MTARIVFAIIGAALFGFGLRAVSKGVLYRYPWGWIRRAAHPRLFWLHAGGCFVAALAVIAAAVW